ncbi:hypothetical protein VIGAN_08340300 [Vigna angularis var. angularis]|uniref:Uncharacterized protein n=1 Tax=Vigna angularis var. angularis TaxID=157739 RepID=A0A0S3SUA2_PHAAN|nr:hypothetical protein VIGAN_08340300 [Vigna angularis var. angularis]
MFWHEFLLVCLLVLMRKSCVSYLQSFFLVLILSLLLQYFLVELGFRFLNCLSGIRVMFQWSGILWLHFVCVLLKFPYCHGYSFAHVVLSNLLLDVRT